MAGNLRILIVDDDRDNADSLAELFELEGHSASVVYDGEAAIVQFRSQCFDVAFMDVMMPGRNGVESFLEIKRMQPAARVYMMTGYSVEQLLQQAMDGGALGVVHKPIDLRRVIDDLEQLSATTRESIVLLAEDDPDVGPELHEVIEGSGRACELVRDGREALERAQTGSTDVMILDLNMPLINGIEVYAHLKTLGRSVPTVMITARCGAHADALELLQDIEVTGILRKPFDPGELLTKLDRLAGCNGVTCSL